MLPLDFFFDFFFSERRTESNVLISSKGDRQCRCFLVDFIHVVSTEEAILL